MAMGRIFLVVAPTRGDRRLRVLPDGRFRVGGLHFPRPGLDEPDSAGDQEDPAQDPAERGGADARRT